MRELVTLLLGCGVSGYLGFWLGVRRERGIFDRAERIREAEMEEAVARRRGGVRLRRMTFRR